MVKGNEVKVDDEDFEYLNQWKWQINKGYATRIHHIAVIDRKQKVRLMSMHREVLRNNGLEIEGFDIDHINRDRLDNRKENLRIATRSQNNMNSKIPVNNTSGFKGVSWHKQNKKWYARISVNRKVHRLGFFSDKMEAVKKYDQAMIKYFGEFALPNYVQKIMSLPEWNEK